MQAIKAAQAAGLQVYADIVFNHKLGGDVEEEFKATPFNPENRTEQTGDLQTVRAATHFTFPGRKGKYSELQWHWWHFNAVDSEAVADHDAAAVYLFEGKAFHEGTDLEKGNYDYLMGCNLDIRNPDVRKELMYWGEWFLDTTGVNGFRFDAVKHVESWFFSEWLQHVRQHAGGELFAVGEYWSGVGEALEHFVESTGGTMMLFDAGLHYNFATASSAAERYDLRKIFDGSLVQNHPNVAVTLVSNHDTQPLQSLESVVEPWFIPLAYALILLRKGGYPCIFAADYYGAEYKDTGRDGEPHEVKMASHRWLIDRFLQARKSNAFGEQYDYFDDPHAVGWTRVGNDEHPGTLAVLLSNEGECTKAMETGAAETTYIDLTEHIRELVVTNGDGWGDFRCNGRSVSVWIPVTEQ